MSKGEILRSFVTERLAAASREILQAVDGLVAGYEEEALGFRREIERQSRELEALIQPQVTLSNAGVRFSRSSGSVEEEEGKDEEETLPERPETLEDSAGQTPSRSSPRRSQCQRRSRPQISDQDRVFLWIRILEDSQAHVLSNSVLKKCPLLKLKCPPGLKEADFLHLLRSSFPQLSADDRRFDILTSDKRRRLQPLRVQSVTPENLQRSMMGWEKSPLYIRLKTPDDPEVSEEKTRQRRDGAEASRSSCTVLASAVQEVHTSRQQEMMEAGGDDGADQRRPGPPEDFVSCSAAESKEDGGDEIGENESDGEWKPNDEELEGSDSELQSKTTKRQQGRRSGVEAAETKTGSSDAALACRVCRARHESEAAFVKHAWSHLDDPGRVCGVCGELSESAEALKVHLQSHQKTQDCPVCGESVVGVLHRSEHVVSHSGERPYDCNVPVKNHQKLHKPAKLHRCYTCHRSFELKEQLKAHCRTHTNKKTHLCGVCGKSLSDYRSLSRHKMTHSGERPHSCQVCGRRFKLPGTLRQHEKIHTDRERSYLCDVCCKMFLTSKQLQIHMRRHTNEKPYHCGECGKGFATKGPLTIHMRVHTGETPYSCPDCGWSFKRKSNLDDHVKVHSGHKPFVCGICGKACARKTYLTVHMRTHNGERPYKCTVCDKAFTQSHCLKTHMKSHLVADAAT